MNINMQQQTTGVSYLLNDMHDIQLITREKHVLKIQTGVQLLLYRLHVIIPAPLPPPILIKNVLCDDTSTPLDAVLRHAQEYLYVV